MKKVTNARNVVMAVIQTAVTGVALFILYRYLLSTIGVSQLGVWSVVFAAASAARFSELGLSGSVVKFVAKYIARSEEIKSAQVIETATISIAVAIGVVLVVAYPLLSWALGLFVPEQSLQDALDILPYAMMSLWLMAIAGIFQSGLDGCQRIDLRSMTMIFGELMRLSLTFLLVPHYGLIGLAFGQAGQSVALLIISWIIIKGQLKELSFVPCRWSPEIFRDMLGYGFNFQIISVVRMLFDPTTKILLSKFGGLSMVGYYEMANRLVMQLRGVLVSATQIVVPYIATVYEITPKNLNQIYKKCYEIVLYFSLPFYAVIAGLLPVIGNLWIGHYEPFFVQSGLLLVFARFVNTLAAPAYFSYLGTGKLRWNTLSHVTTGLLNFCLGYIFGKNLGGSGVIIAFTISLIFGSSFLVVAYHVENRISFLNLLPKKFVILTTLSIFAAITSLLSFFGFYLQFPVYLGLTLILLTLAIFIGPPFWSHPMRVQILMEFNQKKK